MFFRDKELLNIKRTNCKFHAIVIEADHIERILNDENFYAITKKLHIDSVVVYRRLRGRNSDDFKNVNFGKLKRFKTIYIYGDWRERYLTQHIKAIKGPEIIDYGYDFFGLSGVNTWETPWFNKKRMKLPYDEY